MKQLSYISILICLLSFGSQGQDLMKDYTKSKNAYSKTEVFSIQIVKRVLLDGSDVPMEESITKMDVDKLKYKKETSNELIVCNGSEQIIMNKPYKTILIQHLKVDTKKKKEIKPALFSGFDTIIKMASTKKFTETDTEKFYKLTYKVGPFRQIDFSFNKKTNFINYITYYMVDEIPGPDKKKKKWRMQIAFQGLNLKPTFRKGFFSLTPYVVKDKNGYYTLSSMYSKYKLIQ